MHKSKSKKSPRRSKFKISQVPSSRTNLVQRTWNFDKNPCLKNMKAASFYVNQRAFKMQKNCSDVDNPELGTLGIF